MSSCNKTIVGLKSISFSVTTYLLGGCNKTIVGLKCRAEGIADNDGFGSCNKTIVGLKSKNKMSLLGHLKKL